MLTKLGILMHFDYTILVIWLLFYETMNINRNDSKYLLSTYILAFYKRYY